MSPNKGLEDFIAALHDAGFADGMRAAIEAGSGAWAGGAELKEAATALSYHVRCPEPPEGYKQGALDLAQHDGFNAGYRATCEALARVEELGRALGAAMRRGGELLGS